MGSKTYLITGFSGFVARHFVDYLESKKVKVKVVGVSRTKATFLKNKQFQFVKVSESLFDLRDKKKIEALVKKTKPDFVLHLASESSVLYSWKNPSESFFNNTNIFLNLLEAIRYHSPASRVLSVGSSEEYGKVTQAELPLTESRALNPLSPYAVARVSQELLSKIYGEGFGLKIIMTRSFNHIGQFQDSRFVVSSLVKQIVEKSFSGNKRITVLAGDVSIVRDFVDVRDVVRAYALLLTSGKTGEIYNVCSGKGIPLRSLIQKISKMLGMTPVIKMDPRFIRPDDNPAIVGSFKKINKELGWKPTYLLEQTLQEMIALTIDDQKRF